MSTGLEPVRLSKGRRARQAALSAARSANNALLFEVERLYCQGLSQNAIARRLEVSTSIVHAHVQTLRKQWRGEEQGESRADAKARYLRLLLAKLPELDGKSWVEAMRLLGEVQGLLQPATARVEVNQFQTAVAQVTVAQLEAVDSALQALPEPARLALEQAAAQAAGSGETTVLGALSANDDR